MKNLFLAFIISVCLFSCTAQDGKVIEVEEVKSGKFVVVGEHESENSYVVVKYLNGEVKNMTFDQAEQFINSNPPSASTSQVFNNYDGGHNQGGITFSDLILYHMMFGGFGGNSYHKHIVERYPSYYQNIHPTTSVNYPSYRRNKESEFSSSKSTAWKETKPAIQAQKSNFKTRTSETSIGSNPKKQKLIATTKSTFTSRPKPSSFGNSASSTKSTYTSRPSSSFGSSSSSSTKSSYASKPSSSSWGGSSKSSSFGSRKR